MKKMDIVQLVNTCGGPLLVMVLGAILLIHPDSATVLITKLLGWVLVICAGGCGANALLGPKMKRSARLFCALGFLWSGIWLLNHPLVLARLLGRVLGLILLAHGGSGLYDDIKAKRLQLTLGNVLSAGSAVLGIVLVLLPMTTTRLLFSLVGIVMLALGLGEIYHRLNRREELPAGDPNIIDGEKA